MPTDGRWRALIVGEVVLIAVLLLVIAATMFYVITADRAFGVSWGTLGVAGAATMGEAVRRFRHLRTDLANYQTRDGVR